MLSPRCTIAVRLAAAGLLALALGACSPGAPKGVDKDQLDAAISRAIGDPGSCLLIAERANGKLVYRYNSHTACGRALPSCAAVNASQTVDDLLKATVKDGQTRTLSCSSTSDASRGVGWAAGAIPGKGLVYAAVMEGDRAFPGRMMADRLARSFKDAGL
jgi:hypothetical protein